MKCSVVRCIEQCVCVLYHFNKHKYIIGPPHVGNMHIICQVECILRKKEEGEWPALEGNRNQTKKEREHHVSEIDDFLPCIEVGIKSQTHNHVDVFILLNIGLIDCSWCRPTTSCPHRQTVFK